MLTINLGGKVVTTTTDKQTLIINDMLVDIECIGNVIYVNQISVNVAIPENKSS